MGQGPKTDNSGQIMKSAADSEHKTLAHMLQHPEMQAEMARALPKHITAERMLRVGLTALRTTPDLMRCTPETFFACMLQSAQLGLEVNTPLGQAYLIPRKNKYNRDGRLDCTMIIGYQGYMELATRSGRVTHISAHSVRLGDDFSYKLGLKEDIHHVPSDDADREKQLMTHVYAVAHMKEGPPAFRVLSIGQVNARRARSAAGNKGPWKTDYEAMALKTAVRDLWKWIPKSSEMQTAIKLDAAVDKGGEQFSALTSAVSDSLESQGMLPSPDQMRGAIDIPENDEGGEPVEAVPDATPEDGRMSPEEEAAMVEEQEERARAGKS